MIALSAARDGLVRAVLVVDSESMSLMVLVSSILESEMTTGATSRRCGNVIVCFLVSMIVGSISALAFCDFG